MVLWRSRFADHPKASYWSSRQKQNVKSKGQEREKKFTFGWKKEFYCILGVIAFDPTWLVLGL